MKKIFITLYLIALIGLIQTLEISCAKEEKSQIMVSYNWTASLEYYNDDVPIGGNNAAVRGEYYGPIPSGYYTYHYKLTFEGTERTGGFFLYPPVSGTRKYKIGIYNYSFDVSYFDE